MNMLIKSALVSFFLLAQCSSSMQSKSKNQDLIVGQWQGKLGTDMMVLVFRKDNSVTFDYTKAGGIVKDYQYSFDGDSIVAVSGFEKMLIKELDDSTLSFQPIENSLKESVDIIYAIKFARINN